MEVASPQHRQYCSTVLIFSSTKSSISPKLGSRNSFMFSRLKEITRRVIQRAGFDVVRTNAAVFNFRSDGYLRHNARRLEHLASLQIPVAGLSVLEIGAGIGDHSHYYIDRDCVITITEARSENLEWLKKRYPTCKVQ